MQPIERDDDGIIRFKSNAIVRYLLDDAQSRGRGLNHLATIVFSDDDRTQLAQLIGYSVSGASDLSYFDRQILAKADRAATKLI